MIRRGLVWWINLWHIMSAVDTDMTEAMAPGYTRWHKATFLCCGQRLHQLQWDNTPCQTARVIKNLSRNIHNDQWMFSALKVTSCAENTTIRISSILIWEDPIHSGDLYSVRSYNIAHFCVQKHALHWVLKQASFGPYLWFAFIINLLYKDTFFYCKD